MSTIIGEVSIPADDQGFVLMQCPLCGEFFKIKPEDYHAEDVIEIWCPSCGLKAENYFTDDVIELALKKTKNYANDLIYNEMKKWEKKFKGSFISFKAGKKPQHEEEYPIKYGIEALEAFKNQEVHLALLDIMMPNIDGITVMEEIRKTSVIPIIFITAMSTDSDKVLALELGADDYIVKPINTIELTARVASQLSRCYQYVNNKEEKQEYLTIININSRRATKIITDLFEFSLLDSMDYKLNMKNVDVNEVLREIVAYYIPELEAKDFNYDFNISEEEYLVNIDEVKFTRAISNLIDKDNKIENEKIVIKHSIEKSTDLLLSELMKGDADLAIVPSNLALQSYKKQLGYKIAGTIGWGALYLVSSEDISDLTQLEGCEIYNTGKGLTPDIIFRRILNQNNVNEENIKFSYVGAASELAPLVISEQAKYAILPEPALSTVLSKNKNIKIILNLNEEWKKENNVMEGYPQSTLLIKEDFYNKLKESNLYDELINRFIDSEKWVKNNPQLTAEKCEKFKITVNNDTIDELIKNSNLRFTKISDCKNEYEVYFSIIDQDSEGKTKEYDALFIEE